MKAKPKGTNPPGFDVKTYARRNGPCSMNFKLQAVIGFRGQLNSRPKTYDLLKLLGTLLGTQKSANPAISLVYNTQCMLTRS